MKKFIEIFKHLIKPYFNNDECVRLYTLVRDGELEQFKKLLENKSKKIPDEKINVSVLFQAACVNNHLSIVKYMLESSNKAFHSSLLNAFFNETNLISETCEKGNTSIVEYLFNLPEVKNHQNAPRIIKRAFYSSSKAGHFDLIKIFSSSNFKKHIDIEESFQVAFDSNSIEIIQYFIFALKVEQTDSTKDYLDRLISLKNARGLDMNKVSDRAALVKNMFNTREFNNELNDELTTANDNKSTVKINKI